MPGTSQSHAPRLRNILGTREIFPDASQEHARYSGNPDKTSRSRER
jgi:hypothetical protein